MLDYSLPIARRTRARVDQAYKEYFEKKKKKKDGVGDSAGVIQPTGGKLLDGSNKLGSCCRMDPESVAVSDGGEEEASVQIIGVGSLGEGEEDTVDSCSGESVKLKNGKKSKLGFGKTENVGPIDEENSDHDMVFVGEEGGGGFGCLNLQKSEGASEVAGDKASEDEDVSDDNSKETQTLSSEDESSYSEHEDYEPGAETADSGDETADSGDEAADSSDETADSLGQLNSLGGDVQVKKEQNDNESEVRQGSGEVGEGQSAEVGVKRKRRLGLDILLDTHNDIDSNKDHAVNSGQKFNCVAHRTRSQTSSSFGKKRTEPGTFSQPIFVDEDDLGYSGNDDGIDGVDETCCNGQRTRCHEKRRSDDKISDDNGKTYLGRKKIGSDRGKTKSDEWNDGQKVCKKNEGDLGNSVDRKCTRATKNFNFFKNLVHSFYDEKEVPLEGFASSGDEAPEHERTSPEATKKTLPLKFTFNLGQSSPPEKSDSDSELDRLWALCDFGSNDSNEEGLASFGDEVPEDDKNPSAATKKTLPLKFTFQLGQLSQPEKSDTDSEVEGLWAKYDFSDINSTDPKVEGLAFFGNEAPEEGRDPEAAKMMTLPLKFDFKLEQSSVLEKSDFDRELDKLWLYCDFALSTCEIGSTNSNVVENKDSLPPVNEADTDTATLCSKGNHQYILDEEIGVMCRFCFIVKQEIKYCMPSFDKNPFGKYGRRGFQTEEQCNFDEHEAGFNSHFGSDTHVNDEEGTVWDLIPGVKRSMYSHQREGFEFIWNHLAGEIHLEELEKTFSADGGNGCLISHAPGTGKTRLTIVFLQSFMAFCPQARPLIIAPCTMLLTWGEELKKWNFRIPFHNLNDPELSGQEDNAATNCMKRESQFHVRDKRMLKLYSWRKEKSILVISYRLFENLCGGRLKNKDKNKTSVALKKDEVTRKILLENPDVVVFDEGHTARNDDSHIWKAISQIKTKRRILLSGTPFQNNFQELFNTVRLLRPESENSISSREYRRRDRKNFAENTKLATEFRAKISPFVHAYRGGILQNSLPGLRKCLVTLQPTQLQESFIKRIQGIKKQFEYERFEAEISVHPSIMLKEDMFSGDWDILKKVQSNPGAGVKAKFVIELVRLCDALNERVLVFSQYRGPLKIARDLLKSQFQWTEGLEVLYMDGECDAKQRQSSIKVFNDPSSKAKVLLAATRACNEGINLVGASRVVLLDVTWNPSVERQAISRAYRLGQKNLVFIYHLIMAETKEEHKHSCQVEKHRLSELVLFCSNRVGAGKKIADAASQDKVLEEMVQHEKLEHIFKRITVLDEDKLKA